MTDFLVQTFKSKGMAPNRIYSMADKHQDGNVKFGTILKTMSKFNPTLTDDFLDHVPSAF
jgi:hypothetical protein